MDYIVFAIPFFFLMIVVEVLVAWMSGKRLYRFNDSVNDLSMGIMSTVGGAFIEVMMFALYIAVWDYFRIFDFGASRMGEWAFPLWVWVLAFVFKDFTYYWAHRMSHEMNIGWATHEAHHQSEEYNLSVALRQGMFQPFFFFWFALPMAFIGFPPVVYIVVAQLVTLYQFWIHTRAIGKLGPLEWVLNTPSHHRVHHGRDDKYIDKNHAGTFILWDRMFGTFTEEEEEPHYGTVSSLHSWNPVWAQVHYMSKLVTLAWRAPDWRDKLCVWFMQPGWTPRGLEAAPPDTAQPGYQKYDARAPLGLSLYILAHFIVLNLLTVGFLISADHLDFWAKVLGAAVVFVTVACLGGLFEGRVWAFWGEILRTIALVAIIVLGAGSVFSIPAFGGYVAAAVVIVAGALSLYWFTRYRALFHAQAEGLAVNPAPTEKAA